MNLSPNALQAEIAETARTFLADRLAIARLRGLADDAAAIDDAGWRACAGMGWLAIPLAEAEGGLGLGMAEAVMVFREIGRHLTPGPLRSTMIAALVAAQAGEGALAQALAAGGRRAGFAIGELALDTRAGDLLLTLDEAGGALREVSAIAPARSVDPLARLGRAETGPVLARAEDPLLLTRMRILVTSELLGIAEAVRDMSAAYAQVREQFGKPIGAFQAVKHRCADMAIGAYAARAQLCMAAVRLDGQAGDAAFHAAAAHVLALDTAKKSTADNIQNHGGIGITAEHDCHLYLKRALLLERLLGPQRDSFAAVIDPARHLFD